VGELVFIGLGLQDERSITLRGVEETNRCDRVFAEFYTNPMPDLSLQKLEGMLGKKVHILSRSQVEEDPIGQILTHAKTGRVAFLVSGDPIIATTHIELRLLAEKNGIKTTLVHSSSIYTVAAATVGLQLQKFGRAITLPIMEGDAFPESPYDFLAQNKKLGLHTLALLENRPDGRHLSISDALQALKNISNRRNDHLLGDESLVVGLARVDSSSQMVQGNLLGELMSLDFGGPPHSLIIPGRLHFKEAEALHVFAHVPHPLLEAYL
jgi:diphthine synthase